MLDQNLVNQIKESIADATGLDVEEIGLADHLEEDLMLSLHGELPKLIAQIAKELNIEISASHIADFISSLEDEPERAIVSELINFLTEEAEFN